MHPSTLGYNNLSDLWKGFLFLLPQDWKESNSKISSKTQVNTVTLLSFGLLVKKGKTLNTILAPQNLWITISALMWCGS